MFENPYKNKTIRKEGNKELLFNYREEIMKERRVERLFVCAFFFRTLGQNYKKDIHIDIFLISGGD